MGQTHTQPAPGLDVRDADAVLHDIRNFLTTIASLVGRVRGTLLADPSRGWAELVETSSRLDAIVDETIALSRGSRPTGRSEALDAKAYILDHASALSGLMGPEQALSVTLTGDRAECTVDMDSTDLLRVLVNIVVNAAQASPERGAVDLRVGRVRVPRPARCETGVLAPGAYVSFQVADRGPGPAGMRRTARRGGRGLGLAVVSQLLVEAGGGLRIEAREGGGALVELLLPSAGLGPRG